MKLKLDKTSEEQILQCLDLLKNTLKEDLLGLYLYGSAIIGGLQKYSDIDLFVVSNRAITFQEKTQLVKQLLTISGVYMQSLKKPIEMTIVIKSEINPWRYPPKFDFQYGDWLRKTFESGDIEPWTTKEMPDLAIIVTQVLLASETIWGVNPKKLLTKVPFQDFIQASVASLSDLMADLQSDTRNVLLTLARIWSTLQTSKIRSKPEAANWVIKRLPQEFQLVMQRARAICLGEENEYWNDIELFIQPCADFMLHQINR